MINLIDEIRQWAADYLPDTPEHGYPALEEILSRHSHDKDKEPLAVLADRKGYPKTRTYSGEVWSVYIWGRTDMVFEAPTYASAEQAAREYLNKLEDKP